MNLNNEQIEILMKYLPEDTINNILNYQKIIDYVCEKHKISEQEISAKCKAGVLPHARMILVALTIKIFDPYTFEDNVHKGINTKIKTGLSGTIAKSLNANYTLVRFYLNKIRDYIYSNQIDIEYIKKMEVEVLNKFEYINNYVGICNNTNYI